jgi:hypothetical protein
MSKRAVIKRIDPGTGISGGEIAIELTGPGRDPAQPLRVFVDRAEAHIVAASRHRLLALVPALARGGEVEVSIGLDEADGSAGTLSFLAGYKVGDGFHSVANPAFDPADGSLFVTRSGSRGEHVPVSLYRVSDKDVVEEFSGDVTNPSAIAI